MKTELDADQLRYDALHREMDSLIAAGDISERFLSVWAESEEIKNRWGGMPPAHWREDARAEIAAVTK